VLKSLLLYISNLARVSKVEALEVRIVNLVKPFSPLVSPVVRFFPYLESGVQLIVDTDSMTDPSYLGQILVFTSPMIGNYGVPSNDSLPEYPGIPFLESSGIQCTGVVVSDVALKYSHYQAVESLHEWCERHDVPGLTGVDTRAITSLLRDQGTTLGRLAVGDDAAHIPSASEYWDPSTENLVAQASTKEVYTLNANGKGPRIAVLDFGSKANILRSLVERDAVVTVFPWDYNFYSVKDNYDGLFLTNGPGDPKKIHETATRVRQLIDEWDRPIFGICMGHQVLGLAAGMEAYRMTFGSVKAGRVYVTVSPPLHDPN
jgi:carbamoyl-phosphate synthase small subunit